MRILGISGSLPASSSNTGVLRALAGAIDATDEVVAQAPLDGLPYFNPEIGDAGAPVVAFREAIGRADAVVIASPEYAHSLPGVLKNALDWVVGSGELYGKPVAILCATPRIGGGALGRGAIEQTLRAQGANVVVSESVLVRKSNPLADELASDETTAVLRRVVEELREAQAGR